MQSGIALLQLQHHESSMIPAMATLSRRTGYCGGHRAGRCAFRNTAGCVTFAASPTAKTVLASALRCWTGARRLAATSTLAALHGAGGGSMLLGFRPPGFAAGVASAPPLLHWLLTALLLQWLPKLSMLAALPWPLVTSPLWLQGTVDGCSDVLLLLPERTATAQSSCHRGAAACTSR